MTDRDRSVSISATSVVRIGTSVTLPGMIGHLHRNRQVAKFSTRILAHVEQEAAKVPENVIWLASSDIIESVFGKDKSFTAKGPLKEIGKLVLAIPVFVCNLSTELIREAMETVRMIDVEDWIDKHPGKSMLSRRRQALKAPTSDTQTA